MGKDIKIEDFGGNWFKRIALINKKLKVFGIPLNSVIYIRIEGKNLVIRFEEKN